MSYPPSETFLFYRMCLVPWYHHGCCYRCLSVPGLMCSYRPGNEREQHKHELGEHLFSCEPSDVQIRQNVNSANGGSTISCNKDL